jgi:hypothetical protein
MLLFKSLKNQARVHYSADGPHHGCKMAKDWRSLADTHDSALELGGTRWEEDCATEGGVVYVSDISSY